ncbi:MAG TPA: hypothetical protein VHU86_08675 [Solirubrobacterales bacterium]|nr:hypothetical protein [Solirubrobacterales bacterium]
MKRPRRCPHTGLTIPECSCRACCRALVGELVAQEGRPGRPAAALGPCRGGEAPTGVCVLVLEHGHGRDVSVYTSEQLAIAAAAEFARTWWAEARGRDSSLSERPPASDAKAVNDYFAAQEGFEFHEIVACPVQGSEAGAAREQAVEQAGGRDGR